MLHTCPSALSASHGTHWLQPAYGHAYALCAVFAIVPARVGPPSALLTAGEANDGKFMFRSTSGKGNYVLSVMFKGKPSHHKLVQSAVGKMELNKKAIPCATLDEVHEYLKEKRKGLWFVRTPELHARTFLLKNSIIYALARLTQVLWFVAFCCVFASTRCLRCGSVAFNVLVCHPLRWVRETAREPLRYYLHDSILCPFSS